MKVRELGVLAAAALCLADCSKPRQHPKLIVLGIDGMDPDFVERHWSHLPNLASMRAEGGFQRLKTTMPPQSPVAWSSFITGLDPGSHGIFDFIHRDPKTLEVRSSLAETVEPGWKLPVGPWVLPLSRGAVRGFRRGKAFWQTLAENGVAVNVLRMPNNFPPVECEGLSLAGMGTPDLAGTFGTFTVFSSDPGELAREVPGGRFVNVTLDRNRTTLRLKGPENSLRRDRAPVEIDITIDVDPLARAVRIQTGDSTLVLQEREWSGWVRVRFPLMGPAAGASGILRFYLKQAHPHLRLYVSPVNIDPEEPALPISTPGAYSRALARSVGPYYTQGIAEDTAALRQGALGPDEFVQQANLVAGEHLKLLDQALADFQGGLLFFHFFGVDQMSHMFWARDEAKVLAMYERADRMAGDVRRRVPDAEILVLSDHGFTTFERAVHLNAWLRAEGFLTLKDGANGDGLGSIDWSRTQAYAAGLNGLYVNAAGREREGIIAPENLDRIRDSIRERLLAARDPAKGAAPVEAVYVARDVFRGTLPESAPDLIVGYAPGFRASWQTALGQTPDQSFEDNNDAWIGDHCVAAHRVPGVFSSNRKFAAREMEISDVTRILLGRFGLEGK